MPWVQRVSDHNLRSLLWVLVRTMFSHRRDEKRCVFQRHMCRNRNLVAEAAIYHHHCCAGAHRLLVP